MKFTTRLVWGWELGERRRKGRRKGKRRSFCKVLNVILVFYSFMYLWCFILAALGLCSSTTEWQLCSRKCSERHVM